MAQKKVKTASQMLASIIVEGIFEKKGEDVVTIDLRKIPNAVADFFVLCHAGSRNQVEAISDSVQMEVKKAVGQNVWKKEGFENAEWVLLDYVDVVVHIFQEPARRFYRLEELWADAELTECKPVQKPARRTRKNLSAEA
ncbi:MAG TPA: ribosome silencing factor [Lentimicrobium sp.]|jgi:ribosome-associated protein|nr:ribosome silencing factor [Lentimicrobium sp.]